MSLSYQVGVGGHGDLGVSGRAIVEALIAGRADPAIMAELAKGRMRSQTLVLAPALTGLTRDHHRRLLALQLAHSDFKVQGYIDSMRVQDQKLSESNSVSH